MTVATVLAGMMAHPPVALAHGTGLDATALWPTAPMPLAGRALPRDALSPDAAATIRERVHDELGPEADPAVRLDAAHEHGDPILFMEAAEAFLSQAKTEGDVASAREAQEAARIALDILYFLRERDTRWTPVADPELPDAIDRAESVIEQADTVMTDTRPADPRTEPNPSTTSPTHVQRDDVGREMVALGGVLTTVGIAGVGMTIGGVILSIQKQEEVEQVDPMDTETVDRLDDQGRRANVLAYTGAAFAAVGLGVGITLVALGKKRLRLAPIAASRGGGVVLSGRF